MFRRKKTRMIPPISASPTQVPYPYMPADPLGSYTGIPEEPWEEPVQDADDL